MNHLSDLLGRHIDLVEEVCFLPFAADSAEKDKNLIYEREDKGSLELMKNKEGVPKGTLFFL